MIQTKVYFLTSIILSLIRSCSEYHILLQMFCELVSNHIHLQQ